jgi:hypothetical protein
MVEQASGGIAGGDAALDPIVRRPFAPDEAPAGSALGAGVNAVMGAAATAASCVLGVLLVLVVAATLAVMFVLTAALAACGALAWRFKRLGRLGRPHPEPRAKLGRIGHSWIAYSQASG